VRVLQSGPLYLVAAGGDAESKALIVSPSEGIGDPATFGEIMKFVTVHDPWELVDDHDALPEIVKQAIAEL
jgi:hypothetical protein